MVSVLLPRFPGGGSQEKGIEVHAFFSARNPSSLSGWNWWKNWAARCTCTVIRGAYSGKVQVVTEYLEELLAREKLDQLLYLRLPPPGTVSFGLLAGEGMGQISLEERMACGLGACVGCVTEIVTDQATGKREYQRVCKEGPVFWVEEVGMLYDYC